MKCAICKNGETRPGLTTATLERNGVTVLIREVPADICDVCGERYYSEATTSSMRHQLESAERAGEELVVRSFAA